MASPITHTAIGYAIHKTLLSAQGHTDIWHRAATRRSCQFPSPAQSVILSNLPDLDALLGLLFKDMKRYHNNISHSFITGLALSLLAAGFNRRPPASLSSSQELPSAVLFLHYSLHLLTDLLSRNKRGLMLFAPISKRRFRLPLTLFYGVRWGSGLFSVKHLWTLASELLFSLIVLQTLKVFRKVSSVK